MSLEILTPLLVQHAVTFLKPQIRDFLDRYAKRSDLAIVVTATEAIRQYNPALSFEGNCLLIDRVGNRDKWEHDYEAIAISKAKKSVRTGKGTFELQPHYLLVDDTVYAGSVVLDDLVVACSGVEAHYDEMVSGWIAVTVKAFCKDKFAKLPEGTDFIR